MMIRWMKQASALAFEMPLAVALGAALTFAIMAMPVELFDGYFAATGLPLLGMAGRIVAAFGFGGLAAWGTWRGLRAVSPPNDRWTIKVSRPSFTPRRADAHPDAPLRRPIFAGSELGAPLDSVHAAPPRRRSIGVARAPKQEVHEAPLPEEVPLPSAGDARDEIAVEEVAAAAPLAAPQPPLESEVRAAKPPLPAPAGPADELHERESIAALMRRLEDRLALRSAEPASRSAPAAWLVRHDGDSSARKSA